MTDNFEQIADWLEFAKTPDPDHFLFAQVIKRRKENPEMTSNNKTMRSYYIKDHNELLNRKNSIVECATLNNARAYINLNVRSYSKSALLTMSKLATNIVCENYRVDNLYDSILGSHHDDPHKTWVVDFDIDENVEGMRLDNARFACSLIDDLVKETGKNLLNHMTIPTRNGYHYITNPFNLAEFRVKLALQSQYIVSPDVHKNNPTILYIP